MKDSPIPDSLKDKWLRLRLAALGGQLNLEAQAASAGASMIESVDRGLAAVGHALDQVRTGKVTSQEP